MRWKGRKVAVLLGGLSNEREVSLRSGGAVAAALRGLGYDVVEIDAGRDLTHQLSEAGAEVVVVMLHGTYGEDGCVQGVLELAGLPYSGSGVCASALTMDKALTKRVLAAGGIPVAPDMILEPHEALAGVEAPDFGLPAVVKPCAEGSSVGVAVAQDEDAYRAAVAQASRYGRVMVEAFVPGPEVTVAVLDGRAMTPVEVRPRDGFYDYENKYTAGKTDYICPAEIPGDTAAQVRAMAERACALCGVEGVARVDFLTDGGSKPVLLEVNTIPGMTELSLVPMAASGEGMGFAEVAERILDSARLRSGRGN